MKSFNYNDMDFSVEKSTSGFNLLYKKADGTQAFVGCNLFSGMTEAEAFKKAEALARSIFPVGIKIIGPDTTRPNMIGDMKIVGPDVTHPNFIYWDKNSSSQAKNIG